MNQLPIRLVVPLLLVCAACTSQPAATTPEGGEVASAPAGEPAAPAPRELRASELEGVWVRDDGPRYQLVAAPDGRLLGQRLDDDDLGCRLTLETRSDQLVGQALFTRHEDEGGLLRLDWELRRVDDDRLLGRVQGADLDLDDELREVGRAWEGRELRRVARFSPEEAEAARAVLAAQRVIDAALVAGAGQDAILDVFTSPEVRALEQEVPGREAVGQRLIVLAGRLGGGEAVPAGAPRPEEPPVEGEAAGSQTLALTPHLPLELEAPAFCQVVGSEGAASLAAQEGFSCNVVEDAAGDPGRGLIPEFARGDVREVLEESPLHVIYTIDIQGELGVGFELRVVLGGKTYHAFADRFTAFTREQVDVMLASLRTLRLAAGVAAAEATPGAAPAAPAAPAGNGQTDMAGFLARFDGKCDGVTAALDAYGAPGLERANMDWFDLREPTIVKQETVAGRDRVTIEAKAGITLRTYTLVWEAGRIVEVIDGGMQ